MNIETKLEEVLKECERLKKENQYLKSLLEKNQISYAINEDNKRYQAKEVSKSEIIKQRIKLFRTLFNGRTDIFAVRYTSKNGRSGYVPACELEWHPQLCGKPKIKCASCINRKFIPLTDLVIYEHLTGKRTVGIYPLLENNRCNFLAIDFDKSSWVDDSKAFMNVCHKYNVPTSLEKSRSGDGCHVWIFFSETILASVARNLGRFLIEKTLQTRYQMGLDSFDRMFPNQDSLPKGGFGNLIALPLQREPREQGNSVFIDENYLPYPNQWDFLASIKKLSEEKTRNILNSKMITQGDNPVPKCITIEMKNGIYIDKSDIYANLLTQFIQLASFSNPEFYKAQAKRLSTHRSQRLIDCSEIINESLVLPRGCMVDIEKFAKEHAITLNISEKRYVGETINVHFHGQLTNQQEAAVKAKVNYDNGVLAADTGFGKTVTAAAMIAQNQVNTLIIVNRTQLINQWKERLSTFLDIPNKDIGQIGGGKNKPTGIIDIATIQSLNRQGQIKSEITQYGQVIVDECHHISAFSFEKVLKAVRAKKVYGLTATPIRKDGLHPIIFMQCGPIPFKTDPKKQAKIRPFHQKLVIRNTELKTNETDLQKLYSTLTYNDERNDLIFNDVLLALEEKRSPIILTERLEHISELKNKFKGFAKNTIILSGAMKKKERQEALKKLLEIPDHEERLLIATGKYIGEGFDDARLDTLFLTMPISWKGTLQQYVGRHHRNHTNKKEVKVYDYVDKHVPQLLNMFEKRLAGYKALGYKPEDGKRNYPDNEQMILF